MGGSEYQKIPSPFIRHTEGPYRNKFTDEWATPELAYTKDLSWLWTEKVDGANIRIIWDGHRVELGGRTDTALIPAKLINVLKDLAPEELFEQQFGASPAVLYGEGYGAGIQSGGVYRPDMSFVLFDVRVDGWWLRRASVEAVAEGMGLNIVPLVFEGSIPEAIELVKAGLPSAWNPDRQAEGLVGVTPVGLVDRAGDRLMVKIKGRDFQ